MRMTIRTPPPIAKISAHRGKCIEPKVAKRDLSTLWQVKTRCIFPYPLSSSITILLFPLSVFIEGIWSSALLCCCGCLMFVSCVSHLCGFRVEVGLWHAAICAFAIRLVDGLSGSDTLENHLQSLKSRLSAVRPPVRCRAKSRAHDFIVSRYNALFRVSFSAHENVDAGPCKPSMCSHQTRRSVLMQSADAVPMHSVDVVPCKLSIWSHAISLCGWIASNAPVKN